MNNAPYWGGFSPGANQFAVDGNFYSCDPCGPPKISFPMKGDSVFSGASIIYWNAQLANYAPVQLGTFPNLQPWSANQRTFVIEQDFMVAMEAYVPMPLNTPYQRNWSIGWQGTLANGQPIPQLYFALLVEEGNPEDCGQGIIKVTRRFATPPPTRNELEQFTYTFPGFEAGRLSFSRTVQSRIQYDYFLFDDFAIYPFGSLFPNGFKLDSTTGLYPDGLIMAAQNYYAPAAGAVANNYFLNNGDGFILTTPDGAGNVTIPSLIDYLTWLAGMITYQNTVAVPEIIAEASCMRRWMGNIWERRTRFVQLQ
jgi:hypothetical protein